MIRIVLASLCLVAAVCRPVEAEQRSVALDSLLFAPSDVYSPPPATAVRNPAQAAEAWVHAREAVEEGRVSDAFRWAGQTLALDPDHAEARKLLGYQRVGDVWASAYGARMLRSGYAWDPRFGWVRAQDLQKYSEGLRPFSGRWISPEEDARRHAEIDRGWTVRTDHFLVLTNIDRAVGAELAVRLERVYQVWRQLFGEFTTTADDLKAALSAKTATEGRVKAFQVRYHRNREEYNEKLRPGQPLIDMTLGIYFDAARESHFFAGPDQQPSVIDHETVHQLFYETGPRPKRRLAATGNVWAVEGAASFFESLVQVAAPEISGRAYAIGVPEAGRLPTARHYRIVANDYLPLAELTALGTSDLQHRTDVSKLYSESAGLTAFFMNGRQGEYREAFRKLLAAIYAGRDEADTLEKLTGKSYAELDAEYLEFMRSLPAAAPQGSQTGANR